MRDAHGASFDPARSIAFDLERGQVQLSDGDPHLLVPVSAMLALAAGEIDGRQLGRGIGVSVMGRVAGRIRAWKAEPVGSVPPPRPSGTRLPPPAQVQARDAVRGVPLETVVDMLGGELALLGLGNLRVERWGRALLFVLDPCAIDARGNPLLTGIFEGALGGLAEREVAAVVVDRADGNARILVGSVAAMARAEALVRRGSFFTEVVTALHEDSRGRDG